MRSPGSMRSNGSRACCVKRHSIVLRPARIRSRYGLSRTATWIMAIVVVGGLILDSLRFQAESMLRRHLEFLDHDSTSQSLSVRENLHLNLKFIERIEFIDIRRL